MEPSTGSHSDSEGHKKEYRDRLVEMIPALTSFARRLIANAAQADDMVQETLVKALRHEDKFDPATNLRAWLFTILRNTFYSSATKNKRTVWLDPKIIEMQVAEETNADANDVLDWNELLRYLLVLPSWQRDALVAIGYLGWSYEQAAKALDTTLGTIKSRTSRARDRLRKLIHNMEEIDFTGFDAALFQHATKNVAPDHLYYPIAAAYEELYRDFGLKRGERTLATPAQPIELAPSADVLWDDLVASGVLDEEPSLEDLMRSDLG